MVDVAHMSLIGLEPWYAGLNLGSSEYSLWLNGFAVKDSIPCDNTSKPLQAATILGIVLVFSGSIIPIVGLRYLSESPVFACISSKSNMAPPVVSLPVPAVVGTQINGFKGPGIGIPFPIGAFT